jgi:RimJ/RimL family protein N-acetyltransferase
MTQPSFHIRALGAGDAAAFQALRVRAAAGEPAAVWPTAHEEQSLALDEVRVRISGTEGVIVFGVFRDGDLAAIAGLRRERLAKVAHKATVWGVFVAPEHRRAGLARDLIGTVIAHARETGVMQLHLAVNTENSAARKLYLSFGFAPFGVEPRALRVGDRFYDEELMALPLDQLETDAN